MREMHEEIDERDSATQDGNGRVQLHDLKPRLTDVFEEVRTGLSATPRRLPPKYFYDERGSQLFEAITRQPEYYPTRTEIAILEEHLPEILELLGQDSQLVEYGSGSSRKIRLLLEALRPSVYMPIDISKTHLLQAAQRLSDDYEWLTVHPVCADYSHALTLPWRDPEFPVAGFFPGSSIGNFECAAAARFLARAHDTLGTGSRVLIGVDRRKSKDRLEAAYNDAAGVTADFNRNILVHLRQVLGGDVDADRFEHLAFYDDEAGRVEMHLVARDTHTFRLGTLEVTVRVGDSIHTENSYKYSPEEFTLLCTNAGFEVIEHWSDEEELFSVFVVEGQ